MSRSQMLMRHLARKSLRMFGHFSIGERENEFILENIDHNKAREILHVGCWGSLIPEHLSRRGHKVYGLDIREYPKPKRFSFIKADIISSDISFKGGTFDYIVLLSTIEHIGLGYYGDRLDTGGDRIALERLSILLKHEGRILLTLPFTGSYKQNEYQRVHTKKTFLNLIGELFEIEKEQFFIPLAKRNWIAASEKDAQNVYPPYPESNYACFVLKKAGA